MSKKPIEKVDKKKGGLLKTALYVFPVYVIAKAFKNYLDKSK